jgi:hypothetical protein
MAGETDPLLPRYAADDAFVAKTSTPSQIKKAFSLIFGMIATLVTLRHTVNNVTWPAEPAETIHVAIVGMLIL